MDLRVDISQCSNGQVRVVLSGEVQGEALFGDFQTFAGFIEACQDYINRNSPVPKAFLDAFEDAS